MTRFIFGPPPINSIVESQGWSRVQGYGGIDAKAFAAPVAVGLLASLCIALLWKTTGADTLPLGHPDTWEIVLFALFLGLGHEACHLLGFPGAGLTHQSVWGVWLQAGSPFAQHLQPMGRNRFVAALLLPFVVLSLIPLVLQAVGVQIDPFMQWTSVLNTIGAGADLVAVAKLVFSVPARATVVESNHSLHWKDGPVINV